MPVRIRALGFLLFLLVGYLCPPASLIRDGRLHGQPRGTVVVTVVDETSQRELGEAKIELLGNGVSAVTDTAGRAVFSGIPASQMTLRASLPGYGTVVENVHVTSGEVSFFRFQLPRMEALLSELLVRGRDPTAGQGHSEGRVEGDDTSSRTAADLLQDRLPGVTVDRGNGAIGGGASVRIRGTSSITGSNAPLIYLDGVRIDDRVTPIRGSRGGQALHALETIPATSIRRIRVLRGPAAAARYGDSADGVILIETHRGGLNRPD